jgi:hypothetical protein
LRSQFFGGVGHDVERCHDAGRLVGDPAGERERPGAESAAAPGAPQLDERVIVAVEQVGGVDEQLEPERVGLPAVAV